MSMGVETYKLGNVIYEVDNSDVNSVESINVESSVDTMLNEFSIVVECTNVVDGLGYTDVSSIVNVLSEVVVNVLVENVLAENWNSVVAKPFETDIVDKLNVSDNLEVFDSTRTDEDTGTVCSV